jgi:DNA-binding MarR family transcriptional regulator
MGDISKDIRTRFTSEKLKALINIKFTANWLNSKEILFLKPFEISPQQYNILRILRGAGQKIKVREVKSRMVDRSPNATRLMDKLCDKKLMVRERCEDDRRVVFVEISAKGLDLLNKIDSIRSDDHLSMITEKDAKLLSDILDKIR